MSDGTGWASPGGETPPPRPRYGEYAPGYVPGQTPPPWQQQAPQPGAGAPHAWTPPPRPGLVPLRPLDFGKLLMVPFQALRRNPRPLLAVGLVTTGVATLVSTIVLSTVTVSFLERAESGLTEDQATLEAGAVGAIVLSAIVPFLLVLVSTALLQGVIAIDLARGALGGKARFGELWAGVRGRVGALLGWLFLTAGVGAVAFVVVAVVAGLIIAGVAVPLGEVAGVVTGFVVGGILIAGLVVVSLWLGVKLSLVPSVIVLERAPVFTAVRRSWSLIRGRFWITLGVQLLVSVIVGTVGQIVITPFSLVGLLVTALLAPGGDVGTTLAVSVGVLIVSGVVSAIVAALSTVVQCEVSSLIYVDLRMRREGLDLELQRAVEQGRTDDLTVFQRPDAAPTAGAGSPWAS